MNANMNDEKLSTVHDEQRAQIWEAIEQTHNAYIDLLGTYIKHRIVARYEIEWQRFLQVLHQLFQAIVKHADLKSEMPEVEKTMMAMKAEAAALCNKPSVGGGPSL